MAPPNYDPDGEYSQRYAPPHSLTAADTQIQAVTITVRSTRPTTFQTRNIILRPDEPVNVGRSSRSEAKHLAATPENALFDCPVISRRHAELELKVNKWMEEKYQVFIRDTGSMHGTSVNGQKLVPTRPFQLKKGDTIRLGESVNRADSECLYVHRSSFHANTILDNYDGVTVTLYSINTATEKDTAQVKTTQQGISVPSDSESEFDDDDDSDEVAVLLPSSVHTTPDQGNLKSDSQPSINPGSSRSNFITVEDDDDDEPVPLFTRRILARPGFVPDTYADDPVVAPDSHAAHPPHSPLLQLDEEYAALDESKDVRAAMAVAEIASNADEGFDHEHVNSEEGDDASLNAWSDDDHFSDEEQVSDEHYEMHEDFDRQSFLSEEFNMSDDVAVEDDEDDEGPEIMSSKRRLSNELGTLGDESNHDVSEPTREAVTQARPHYDPVRDFQMSALGVDRMPAYRSYGTFFGAPSYDMFADPSHSNKRDVGPATTLEQPDLHNYSFVSPPYQLQQHMPSMVSGPMPNNFNVNSSNLAEAVPFFGSNAPGTYPPPHPFNTFHANAEPTYALGSSPGGHESNNKKRKAPEISTSDEPATTTQAPTSSGIIETANVSDAATNTVATTVTPTEPQAKKRKIKQAHSQKSMLRTAVIEAGKYTAGAIIGGIGLVTILASPIGEALASC